MESIDSVTHNRSENIAEICMLIYKVICFCDDNTNIFIDK